MKVVPYEYVLLKIQLLTAYNLIYTCGIPNRMILRVLISKDTGLAAANPGIATDRGCL